MKDIKFFGLLSVAALAMSVSSCTNDNEPQVSDNNTENNSGVEGFTIQANSRRYTADARHSKT